MFNNSFITTKIGYICNDENEINDYLDKYSELFVYFTNNQIIPMDYKLAYKKVFYSTFSTIIKNTYFEAPTPLKIISSYIFFL